MVGQNLSKMNPKRYNFDPIIRYKEDWSLEFGPPVQKLTLEDLIEADEKVAGEKEKERMRQQEEKEAWKKILETMTVEERVGYLAARQKY